MARPVLVPGGARRSPAARRRAGRSALEPDGGRARQDLGAAGARGAGGARRAGADDSLSGRDRLAPHPRLERALRDARAGVQHGAAPFLSHIPAHTDLARHHRRLAARLVVDGAGDGLMRNRYDVLHTTDGAFNFARTAARAAAARHLPLVTSVHTDTARYTRIFTAATIERLFGQRSDVAPAGRPDGAGALRRAAHAPPPGRAPAPVRVRAALARRRLVAPGGADRRRAHRALAPRDRAPVLRSGAPRSRVAGGAPGHPARSLPDDLRRTDRSRQERAHARERDPPRSLDRGLPVHLLCAGAGPDREAVRARLGDHATCPGVLDPETLARAYASADLCAQPSEIEELSNAVLEALTSGLPVLVAGAERQRSLAGRGRDRPGGPRRRRRLGRGAGARWSPTRGAARRWGARRARWRCARSRPGARCCSRTCCPSGVGPRGHDRPAHPDPGAPPRRRDRRLRRRDRARARRRPRRLHALPDHRRSRRSRRSGPGSAPIRRRACAAAATKRCASPSGSACSRWRFSTGRRARCAHHLGRGAGARRGVLADPAIAIDTVWVAGVRGGPSGSRRHQHAREHARRRRPAGVQFLEFAEYNFRDGIVRSHEFVVPSHDDVVLVLTARGAPAQGRPARRLRLRARQPAPHRDRPRALPAARALRLFAAAASVAAVLRAVSVDSVSPPARRLHVARADLRGDGAVSRRRARRRAPIAASGLSSRS